MADDTKAVSNVTPKAGSWELAALTLAAGQSANVAAVAANVTPRTVKRWKKKPHFRQLVEEFRAAIVDEALGKLTANATKASDVFAALMDSSNEQVKLAAARCVLDYRSRLHSEAELVKRVEELSLLVKELQHGGTQQDRTEDVGRYPADGDGETESESDEPMEGCAERADS